MKELIETYAEKHLDIVAFAVSFFVLNFLLGLNFPSVVILILVFLSIKLLHLRLFDKSYSIHNILVNTSLLTTLTFIFILNKYCFFLLMSFAVVFILTAFFSANVKIYIDCIFFTVLSLFCLWIFLKPYDISIVKTISPIPYAYVSCIVWTSLFGLILIFLSEYKFDVLSLLLIRQFAIFFSIFFSYYFDKSILSYVIIVCDIYLFYYFLRLLASVLKLNKCVISIILSFMIIIFFPFIIYWSVFGYESDMRKTVLSISNKASIDDIFITDNKKLAMIYMFHSKLHFVNNPKILYISDVIKDFNLLNNSKLVFMTTQNEVPFRKTWKLEKLQGVFKTYSFDSNKLSTDDKIIELFYFFSKNKYFYNKFPEKYKIVFDDIPTIPMEENIIYNSSFESDLNGWEYTGPAGPTFNTVYDEENNFYFLKWSLNTRAKHWAYLNQKIYLSTGLYKMAFDLKANNKNSYDDVHFHLVLTTPDSNRIYLTSSNINTEWKTFSKTIYLSEDGYYTLSLMFGGKWNNIIDLKGIKLIRTE